MLKCRLTVVLYLCSFSLAVQLVHEDITSPRLQTKYVVRTEKPHSLPVEQDKAGSGRKGIRNGAVLDTDEDNPKGLWDIFGDYWYAETGYLLRGAHRLPHDFQYEKFKGALGVWVLSHSHFYRKSPNESTEAGKSGFYISFVPTTRLMDHVWLRYFVCGRAEITIRKGDNEEPIYIITHPGGNEVTYDWINTLVPLNKTWKFTIEANISGPADVILIDTISVTFNDVGKLNPSISKPKGPSRYPFGNSIPKMNLRGGVVTNGLRWPGGSVPFRVMSGLDTRTIVNVRFAMAVIETLAQNCVRFVPMSPRQIAENQTYHLRIEKSNKRFCWASVGYKNYRSGYQTNAVLRDAPIGSYGHELMHALGAEHEHQRWDPANYIDVNETNIPDDYFDQYEIYGNDTVSTFNISSQRVAITDADVQLIMRMYNDSCSGNQTLDFPTTETATVFPFPGAETETGTVFSFKFPGADPGDMGGPEIED